MKKNKKLYVFLTTLIRGVGGGHIYTLCKIDSLKSEGFDIQLIHANDPTSKIYIDGLRVYEKNYDNCFFFPAYFYSPKEQKRVVERVIKRFIPKYGEYEDIYIESQTTTCSTWGELIAGKIRAKHLVYLLDEHPKISNISIFGFYSFKLDRGELAGIGRDSIKTMFEGWRDIKVSPFLLAYNKKPLQDVPYDIRKVRKSDYIIGSIGRTEKGFLLPALTVVKEFALNHANKSFTVLIIGGSVDNGKPEQAIQQLFRNIKNVYVHITGLIYPIPICLVKMPHIFLSTAGGVTTSTDLGKVTISFDINDFKPIGIINYTTQNRLFRSEDEPAPDLYRLLDEVLIEKKYSETNVIYNKEKQELSYKPHFDFIAASNQEKKYYHFEDKGLTVGQVIMKIMIRIVGTKVTKHVVKNYYPLILRIQNNNKK
jgi:hypothetical protein